MENRHTHVFGWVKELYKWLLVCKLCSSYWYTNNTNIHTKFPEIFTSVTNKSHFMSPHTYECKINAIYFTRESEHIHILYNRSLCSHCIHQSKATIPFQKQKRNIKKYARNFTTIVFFHCVRTSSIEHIRTTKEWAWFSNHILWWSESSMNQQLLWNRLAKLEYCVQSQYSCFSDHQLSINLEITQDQVMCVHVTTARINGGHEIISAVESSARIERVLIVKSITKFDTL